jgi:hypothetical protein
MYNLWEISKDNQIHSYVLYHTYDGKERLIKNFDTISEVENWLRGRSIQEFDQIKSPDKKFQDFTLRKIFGSELTNLFRDRIQELINSK